MNAEAKPSVVQVNTADRGGGAERVAWNLFRALRDRGHRSEMLVGFRHGDDPDVHLLPPAGGPWARAWGGAAKAVLRARPDARGAAAAVRAARAIAAPGTLLDHLRGHECFRHPGAWRIAAGEGPDLLHLHNLHGGYFDLRALPELTRRRPTVLTLHDTWIWTGHCSYTLGCERWRTGCGECPHLDTYPALLRDGTAENWRRKQAIHASARLHVAAPSHWLLDQARASTLAPALIDARVIRNGIDLDAYRPADRRAVRRRLGIDPEAFVIVFAANRYRHRRSWKDWPTVREAVQRAGARLAEGRDGPVQLVAIGDAADPRERFPGVATRFVPRVEDPSALAPFVQAADVALHAARPEAESCGLVVLEALACGTPVVATAVGGVPEHVRGTCPDEDPGLAGPNPARAEAADGVLVPPGDAARMADAVVALARRPDLRATLGANGARRAAAEYGLERQIDAYVAWYREILEPPRRGANPDAG